LIKVTVLRELLLFGVRQAPQLTELSTLSVDKRGWKSDLENPDMAR
jgi:hypothetical protein